MAPRISIEARKAFVRLSPRRIYSKNAAWTASVSFYCDGWLEKNELNRSLSESLYELFNRLKAAFASGHVAKSVSAGGRHRSNNFFVCEVEARKAASTISLAEIRPIPRSSFISSNDLSGIRNF